MITIMLVMITGITLCVLAAREGTEEKEWRRKQEEIISMLSEKIR